MHIIVIGAGLMGLTSAYFLRRHGADVTVIEAKDGPALDASFGNGGYNQATLPDPWNAPGVFGLFAKAWLADLTRNAERSAFLTRTRAIPGLMRWGLQFLKYSNAETYLRHTELNARLAQYSLDVLDELDAAESLSYSRSDNGGLIIFRDRKSLQSYCDVAEQVCDADGAFVALDRDQLLAKEPSLAEIARELSGAVFFPNDRSGNPHELGEQLAVSVERHGVCLRYGESVQRLAADDTSVTVTTDQDEVSADYLLISAGAGSTALMRMLGVRLSVAPAKGYSITMPMGEWSNRPQHVIADMGVHAGVNPMGGFLRVAGTAEFAGMRPGISEERIGYLLNLTKQIFPSFSNSIDPANIEAWAGLRPLSSDGIPILGETPRQRVYLNAGHGGLGWTQAAGSGKAVADYIVGASNSFDISDFSIGRFSP